MHDSHAIVILDPDNEHRQLLIDGFRHYKKSYEFITLKAAGDLLKFMERKMEKIPSLICIDISSLGKEGPSIIKKLKTNLYYAAVPVIAFAPSVTTILKENYYLLGVNVFIIKPLNYAEILRMINSISVLWLEK